jgi:hypothetical protein
MRFNCKFYLRPKLLCFLHVTEECKVKIVSCQADLTVFADAVG